MAHATHFGGNLPLVLLLAPTTPVYAQEERGPIKHLEQINEDGFGKHNNRYAWSMESFGDHLFVGTLNTTLGLPFERWPFDPPVGPRTAVALPKIPDIPEIPDFARFVSEGAELWRYDGEAWDQVADRGFGDTGNVGIRNMAVYRGRLYAGTMNSDTGCEIWRSTDGTNWSQFGADGLRNPLNLSVRAMTVWGERLYIGISSPIGGQIYSTSGFLWVPHALPGFGSVANFSVSELTGHKGSLYAGTWNPNGCQIYRYDGLRWNQLVGPESATPAGFGDPFNAGVMSMIEFRDALYVGTANFLSGFTLWRTEDQGATWERVGRSGFGDFRANYAWDMEIHNEQLFLGTFTMGLIDPFHHGASLYSTEDGAHWTRDVGILGRLSPPGFLDRNNYGIRVLEPFQDELHIGTAQCFFCVMSVGGTEVWRRDSSAD
ncbi:MAG: hypothetical protein CME06_14250 [Gemmatimonadetes bacterium]|nr:hypothetical protein [Gemmatimonadota bacterium]